MTAPRRPFRKGKFQEMAKALLGHVGGGDQRVASDLRRLRARVRELEAEVARMREESGRRAGASDRETHDKSGPR
jgi:50S ribosomal subunit-associated GTPase HflX